MLQQIIVVVNHGPSQGIFNGKHSIVSPSLLHLYHGILKDRDMVYIGIFAKILEGGPVAVGPLHALVDNPHAFPLQLVHHGKAGIPALAVLCQKTVLEPAADGHNL